MPLLCLVTAAAILAPVSHVTVYSDRARVVRTAQVELAGTRTVELPLLDDAVDASTIQLEATGAQVQKIDIARATEEDFPRDEAHGLLDKIEALDDRILALNGERQSRAKQLRALRALRPTVRLDDPLRPPPKLNADGWLLALAFIEEESERIQAEQRASGEQLRDLLRDREKLAHRAQQLGGARRRTGHRVTATMTGQGTAQVKLTYMAMRARWFPAYDVQFLADKGQANIAFAGQVSQETGEDWVDAHVVLSTAVPATSRQMPKLLSWKIGERERFIPTPARQQVPPPPAPPPVPQPLPRPSARRFDDNELRQKLFALAQAAPQVAEVEADSTAAGGEDSVEGGVEGGVVGGIAGGALGVGRGGMAPQSVMPPPPPPSPVPPGRRYTSPPKRAKRQAPAKPSAPPAQRSYEQSMKSEAVAAAPRAAEEMPMDMPAQAAVRQQEAQVGLAPPPAYVPPSYSPELPAAQAGGYDLTFPAVRKETIKSGEGLRRVPLLSESWPVKADRVVYPALAPDAAFLVAEIKNPSARVLPGGPAALAVGNDPAGQAQLKLVSPGETFTLPLGLDRNIKPIRNVNLSTAEKGFIGKDELTHYTVTIELANPYRQPVPIRVVDQVPLKANKDAELKLESASPQPSKRDDATGELQWSLTLPPSGKSTVTFVYSLRRPKGYRLYQEQ